MKHLSEKTRDLLGGAVILAGLALMFLLFGTDTAGLLFLLPFAALFAWLCPELWRGR